MFAVMILDVVATIKLLTCTSLHIPMVGIVDIDLVYRDSDLSNGQSSLFLVQGSANMVGGDWWKLAFF